MASPSKRELLNRIADLEDENQDLKTRLDDISDIVSEDEDEDEGDGEGED